VVPAFSARKIDVWLGGATLLWILVSGALAIGLLLQKGLASLAIVPLLATGLALRVLTDTWYGVTDTDLIVHHGPFRATVLIASIRAIRPMRSVVSAPALSLDRLEVTHAFQSKARDTGSRMPISSVSMPQRCSGSSSIWGTPRSRALPPRAATRSSSVVRSVSAHV
jgi:hypothetical protein